jgi:ribokinase
MNQLTAPVIVVVGSLHYDIMVDAPDRPRKGETVTGYAWRPKFGGKGGNQAVAAAKAGATVRMAGAVGDDDFGQFVLDRLEASGVDRSRVVQLTDVGSGMSVAISDAGGDYGAVIVSGANLRIKEADLADPGLWTGARALILQNEVPEAVNLAAARAAKAATRSRRRAFAAFLFKILPRPRKPQSSYRHNSPRLSSRSAAMASRVARTDRRRSRFRHVR